MARLHADRALEQHVVAELMRALQLDPQGSGLHALSVVRLSGETTACSRMHHPRLLVAFVRWLQAITLATQARRPYVLPVLRRCSHASYT